MRKYFILILILISSIAFCLGNNYYVNNKIGDNSTGVPNDINQPYYSLSYAYSLVSSYGDTIYVVDTGETYIDNLHASKQCSIVGIGVNKPKIVASSGIAIFFDPFFPVNPNSSFQFIISNLEIYGSDLSYYAAYIVPQTNNFNNTKLYIVNCKIRGLNFYGVNDTTTEFYITNNYLLSNYRTNNNNYALGIGNHSNNKYIIRNNTFYYNQYSPSNAGLLFRQATGNSQLYISNNLFYSDFNQNVYAFKSESTYTMEEALNNNVYNLLDGELFSNSTFNKPDVLVDENNDTILVGIFTDTNPLNFGDTDGKFQGAFGHIYYDTNDIVYSEYGSTHIYKTFTLDSPKYLRHINIDYFVEYNTTRQDGRIGSDTEPYIKINIDSGGWETYKIGDPLNRLVNNTLDLDIWVRNN